MKHKLSLHIPDTMNPESITIQDTSMYTDLIPVSCPTLQILVPGFVKAVTFNDVSMPNPLQPGFIWTLNACQLDLQFENCGTVFNKLPDGIYVIKYSVSPNDIVYVEYNQLRMVCAWEKWNAKLCELDLAPCDPPENKKVIWNELQEIYFDLLAAKNKVEFCHKPKEGMEMFNNAVKRLDKLNCNYCH